MRAMVIIFAMLMSLLTIPAYAAQATFHFTGMLDGGSPVSGSYTFNTNTAPNGEVWPYPTGLAVGRTLPGGFGFRWCPCPEGGQQQVYGGALTATTVHVGAETAHLLADPFPGPPAGGLVIPSDPLYQLTVNGIAIGNSQWAMGNDFYIVTAPLTGIAAYQFLSLNIDGHERFNVVDDVSLSASPPTLSFADMRDAVRMTLFHTTNGAVDHVATVTLTSLTVAPVPLPATLILFAAGLFALCGLAIRAHQYRPDWIRGTMTSVK